jgi:hypothetical protein
MTKLNRQPGFVYSSAPVLTDLPSTANTNRDGTGTITTVYTAAANTYGSLVEVIKFTAESTTTAGFINLFYSTDAGVTWEFIGQIAVSAFTPSATVQAWEGYYVGLDMPLRMGNGHKLGAAPTKAEPFICLVQGGLMQDNDA